jgi:hypothetical protein
MTERIDLLTRKGGLIATFDVPRFSPPAEVIYWGDRTFVLRHQEQSDVHPLCYRETIAFTVTSR